jgi:hypothetical protein
MAAFTTTLSDIWSAVSNRVGNLDSTVAADQVRMTRWANESIVDLLMRTRCNVTKADAPLTIGVDDYDLDTDILMATNASTTSAGSSWPVEHIDPAEMITLRTSNTSVSSPIQYYSVLGANRLMVYPTPSAAEVLTIYYVPRPTAMSVSSDQPANSTYGNIPTEYVKAIEFYVCAEAADDDDDSTSAQGQRYREMYEMILRRSRSLARQKFGPYNARAMVNPNRRVGRRKDNSIDWYGRP